MARKAPQPAQPKHNPAASDAPIQPGALAAAPKTSGLPPLPALTVDLRGPDGHDRGLNTEWLLTNGLGGFAMGTALGVPARRYHGVLVAATRPPVGRVLTLAQMAERLVVGIGTSAQQTIELSTFQFADSGGGAPMLHPRGDVHLVQFSQDTSVSWTFELPTVGMLVRKTLTLLDGENTAQLKYEIRALSAKPPLSGGLRLHLRPLVALRDFHGLIQRSWADRFHAYPSGHAVRVLWADRAVELDLKAAGADFDPLPQWWSNFHYELDAQRGQGGVEDLWSPGEFVARFVTLEPSGVDCVVQASTTPASMDDAAASTHRRERRQAAMLTAALAERSAHASPGAGPLSAADQTMLARLVRAADDFVVVRRNPEPSAHGEDLCSIIAGYPWFADWGRDTSIALTGLMLVTGRLDEARRVLLAFASHRRNGLVPNVFDDTSGFAEHNTVDASLWFILACCRWLNRGGDRATWDAVLAPACLDVVASYRRGTDHHIAMDPMDKLITAGTPGTQLTWMDARRDGVVFTPRHGKAVEINALWHAALMELAAAIATRDTIMAANLRDLATAVSKSFRQQFWNPNKQALFDCLAPIDGQPGWRPIDELRPNQIFAVSLGHDLLSSEQQRAVVSTVREHLLSPFGLRTLAPGSPNYHARYEGNLFQRDQAYHNGTAWPWLLGPYAEAVLRVGGFSAASKSEARGAIQPLLAELTVSPTRRGPRGCLGQVAEIYDADAPQRPQGCPAQAWSVAELLRVLVMTA